MVGKKNSISSTLIDDDEFVERVEAALYIPPKKYEYIKISDPSTKKFNEMGAAGWRLVSEDGRWSTWEREIN